MQHSISYKLTTVPTNFMRLIRIASQVAEKIQNKSWHNSTAPGDPLLEPKTPYEIEFTPPDSNKRKNY